MTPTLLRPAVLLGLLLPAGCGTGDKQPPFPDAHPVKGVVRQGGKPVSGGGLRFDPDPPRPEFITTATVGPDGAFELTTVRTTDKVGESKPGAPAGAYRVTYLPASADQTAGPPAAPVELPRLVTVEAKDNALTLDFPKK